MQAFFWNIINKITFLLNGVSYGHGLYSRGKIYVYNKDVGKISIGKNVRLNSADWANPIGCGNHIWIQLIGKEADLAIGDGTGISNTAITCMQKVEIGKYCLIGSGCKIYDTDFHVLPIYNGDGVCVGGDIATAPIIIGDRVFVGAGCTILKGVKIGTGSIIGAGSVVTKNIPPNEVWAGNPAGFIKKIV